MSIRVVSHIVCRAALFLCAAQVSFAAASPDTWLPDDTMAFVTAPDGAALRALWNTAPQTAYWRDPAMKAFRDHFQSVALTNFVQPLEKTLGLSFTDHAELLQGRVTLAVLRNGWTGERGSLPGLVLLMDTAGQSNRLRSSLEALAKSWTDAGRSFRTNTVRDVPILTIGASSEDIIGLLNVPRTEPSADGEAARKREPFKIEISVGQSGSLLLVGTALGSLERVLARQANGDVKGLADVAAYQAARTNFLPGAQAVGWADPKGILGPLLRLATGRESAVRPETISSLLGLDGLSHAVFSLRLSETDSHAELSLGAPAAKRTGFLKLLAGQPGATDLPAFVPESATTAARYRLDLKKTWEGLEQTLVGVQPAASGAIRLIMDSAGKDEDSQYDLRKELFGNLGDDIVLYDLPPKSNELEDLVGSRQVFFIASPAPGRLANALRVLARTLSPVDSITSRTFESRRIYRFLSPGAPEDSALHFAAVDGYVAFSSEAGLVEGHLKRPDPAPKGLRDLPGLNAAAEKVGGFGTGLFVYQDQRELMRARVELMRLLDGSGATNPLLALLNPGGDGTGPAVFDYRLHPPFAAVAKYFGFSVISGQTTDDGLRLRIHTPVPVP